ncbi:polyprotein [Iflavirus sp.]|nr:polyprotein [Iflavirus sp.]
MENESDNTVVRIDAGGGSRSIATVARFDTTFNTSGGYTTWRAGCKGAADPPTTAATIMAKLKRTFPTSLQVYVPSFNYTDAFSTWCNAVHAQSYKETKIQTYTQDGVLYWGHRRSIRWTLCGGIVSLEAQCSRKTLKEAQNYSAWLLVLKAFKRFHTSQYPVVQMEQPVTQESIQGQVDQQSTKQENTIITQDTTVTESIQEAETTTDDIVSSEPMATFKKLTDRWMPLKQFTIKEGDARGTEVIALYLPEDLYVAAKCAPNITPFESYVLGNLELHLRVVLNANKFQAGKILCSFRCDPYQAEDICSGYQGMLSRPHIMLDLPARNEGEIRIPFQFRRALVRLAKTQDSTPAVRASLCSVFEIKILSPLTVGTEGLKDCTGQVFYRLVKTKFTGMSHRVVFQMEGLGDYIDRQVAGAIPTRSIRALTRGAEAALDQLGKTNNQDKPTVLKPMVVVPAPRMYFPNSKGLSDASVLRMDPTTLTSYNRVKPPKTDPKTTLDIAKIWGLLLSFDWKADSPEGTVLLDRTFNPSLRFYDSGYQGSPTPLEYACQAYQFWGGPIELRFDFVSTAFHSGTAMISVEFNRPQPTPKDLCVAGSNYTKVFHLGEQRSVTVVVPYIYDTVYRRNATSMYCCNGGAQTSDDLRRKAITVCPDNRTKIRVTVVNAMRPVNTVASTIEVLMYIRGGENFSLMGLKQVGGHDSLANSKQVNFPRDFAKPTVTEWTGGEIRAKAQMDSGEKESEDTTATLSQGVSAMTVQSLDSHVGIKDILRRPVLIVNQQEVKQVLNDNTAFFLPVCPPSRNRGTVDDYGKAAWSMFAPSITKTPQSWFINCFRHWRGSSRYTIVVDLANSTSKVIYVSYLPHSGADLQGNLDVGLYGITIPIYGSGFLTEMIIPSVNPTLTVEVPYETENNWTLVSQNSNTSNYEWRDYGDINAGHLAIQAIGGDAKIDVWWAAGDDFQIANWWGIPEVFVTDNMYRYTDDTKFSHVNQKPTNYEIKKTAEVVKKMKTKRPHHITVKNDKEEIKSNEKYEKNSGSKSSTTTTTTRPVAQSEPEPSVQQQDQPATSNDQPTTSNDLPGVRTQTRHRNTFAPPEGTINGEYIVRDGRWQHLPQAQMEQPEGEERDGQWQHIPQAQMEQQDSEEEEDFVEAVEDKPVSLLGKVSDFLQFSSATKVVRATSGKMLRTAALSCVPVVGQSVAMGALAVEMADKVQSTMGKVDFALDGVPNLMGKMEQLAEKSTAGIDQILQLVENTIKRVTTPLALMAQASTVLIDMFLDILISWIDKSWTSLGVGIVRFIIKIVPSEIGNSLTSFGITLGKTLADWWVHVTQPHVQADEDTFSATLVGILAALTGTILGVHIDSPTGFNFGGMMSRITKATGVMYFVHVINFVKQIFTVVKELVLRALGRVNPQTIALERLSGTSPSIQKFIRDAQSFTSEANTTLLTIPIYRNRCWKIVMQALQLQRLMVEVPNSCVSPVLNRVCQDVIKMGNEKFLDMASCPVRYEPFVICIEGETNIGKSYMTETLVTELLTSIGFTAPSSGVAFYRTPGSEFWSGYRDQPVVVFDEFLQMRDAKSKVDQLRELYQLKSTSTFVPNMAHLEEKRIKGNPLIVVLLTNNAFPALNEVQSSESVHRRRDVLLRARMSTQYTGRNPRDLPREVTQHFGHLRFENYEDVTDMRSKTAFGIDYENTLAWLKNEFQIYHANETQNVRARLQQLYNLNVNIPLEEINVDDPFAVFYSNNLNFVDAPVENPLWIASERLEQDVEDLGRLARRPVPPPRPAPPRIPFAANHVEYELPEYPPDGDEMDDMPQVQMLAEVASGFLLLSTLAVGFKMMSHASQFISESTVPTFEGPRAMCSVCQTEQEIMRTCRPNVAQYVRDRTLLHAVCETCWRECVRHGRHHCPACREPVNILLVQMTDMTKWSTMMSWISRGTGRAVETLEFLAKFFKSFARFERWFVIYDAIMASIAVGAGLVSGCVIPGAGIMLTTCAIKVAASVANAHILGDEEHVWPTLPVALSSMNEAVMEVVAEGQRQVQGNPNQPVPAAQMDEEPSTSTAQTNEEPSTSTVQDEEPSTSTAQSHPQTFKPRQKPKARRPQPGVTFEQVPDPILTPIVESPIITLIVTDEAIVSQPESEASVCWHKLLSQNPASVSYHNGKFQLALQPQNVQLPCGPCTGNLVNEPVPTECYWKGVEGRERMFAFYEAFLAMRRRSLEQYVLQWSTATDEMKAYYEAKVPPALQPPWMRHPIVPDEPLIRATSQSWWEWIEDVFEKYKTILQMLAVAVTVAGVVYTTYSAVALCFSPADTPSVQTWSSRVSHARPREILRESRPPYFQVEEELQAIVTKYIGQNTMRIELWADGELKHLLFGLGIFNHTVLIPRHYVAKITTWTGTVKIGPAMHQYLMKPYTPSAKDFRTAVYNDLAVWECPHSVNAFKDIRKFFCKEEDLTKYLPAKAWLHVVPTRTNPNMVVTEIDVRGFETELTISDVDGTPFTVMDVLKYNFSRSGACGSFLCVPRSQRPIVSMHIAGVGEGLYGEGYAVLITQESLGDLSSVPAVQLDEPIGSIDGAKIIFGEETQVTYLGVLPEGQTAYIPTKTKLRKSAIYGEPGLETTSQPAILTATDPRYVHGPKSPLVYGCEKHGKLSVDFATEQLEGPYEFLKDMLATMKPTVACPKKLTPEEAIIGLDHAYYDPMDLKTSAGYPLNQTGKTAKGDWVQVERDHQERPRAATLDPHLQQIVEEAHEQRVQGIRYPTYFIDTLKDEKRPEKKVMEPGGTRIFCNGPFEHAIAMRQNFLHFGAAFMEQRKTLRHAVGINPDGLEWDWLARSLLAKSHNIMTLDYKNFGPAFNARVADKVTQLIRNWTLQNVDGVDEMELTVLLMECSNSRHICTNTKYMQNAGSPSGAVLTTVINSLVNLFYILVAWEALVGKECLKKQLGVWEEFKRTVFVCVYGDDLIMTVKDYEHLYNTVTIQQYFAKYDIVSTDATKGQEIQPYTPLICAEFLKRTFQRHPTRRLWMSKLREESIKSATQWVWESSNLLESTRINADIALKLAHGSGPVEYQKFRTVLNAALVKAKIEPITMTWEEIDSMIFDHGYVIPF